MISVQTYNRLKSLEIEIQMIGSCLGVLSKSINELPYFVPDQGLEAFERFKTSYQSLHGAYVSLSTHNNISEDNFRGQDETRLNDMHQEVHHVRSELVTLFIATLQWVLSGLKKTLKSTLTRCLPRRQQMHQVMLLQS